MTYCTVAQVTTRIGETKLRQLTDDDAATGAVVVAVVNAAIAEADALINSYCKDGFYKYRIPFDPVPAAINALSLVITKYLLYGRRQQAEQVREEYSKAIDSLEKINRGILKLGTTADPPAETVDMSPSSDEADTEDAVFNERAMDAFTR